MPVIRTARAIVVEPMSSMYVHECPPNPPRKIGTPMVNER